MSLTPQDAEDTTGPRRPTAPMLTHQGVWAAIDRLARQNNMTPSGLARRAGLDPTTFNKSKRFAADGRPRWPSTESISKILKATNASAADLFAAMAPEEARGREEDALPIPLLGEARAGGLTGTVSAGRVEPAPDREITLLAPDEQPVYALTVHGDSMEPVFHHGTTLVISMVAPVEPGHRVVVKTRDDVLVKVLSSLSDDVLALHAVNPAHGDLVLPRSEVDWMARIIWASQ